jgi:hypothetical protein
MVHASPHRILLMSDPLAGLFPGVTLLLSNFYKRHAMQLRFTMMYSASSLAGAFSGLLAYGIRNLNGKHGIAGWQWIFIVVRNLPPFIQLEAAYLLWSRDSGGNLHCGFWTRHALFCPSLTKEH